MGILDELKKLTHPYDDEDEEYEDFEEPRERSFDDRRNKAEDRRNKVVNIHATTQLKVVLVKPDRFENASEIADQLKDKRTVVLNLESTNKDVARRLIDFLSGVAYAGEGKIKKVAKHLYHHALPRGTGGRSHRRAGKQRLIFLSREDIGYADTSGGFDPFLCQGVLWRLQHGHGGRISG